jgi:hypothetical protein
MKSKLLLLFLLSTVSMQAQTASVIDWAKSFPTGRTLSPQFMASYLNGGILVAGTTNIPYPLKQIEVMAVDSSGTMLWMDSVTTLGAGSSIDHFRGIACLPDGTSFLLGTFEGQITCNGIVLSQVWAYSNEVFLIKFDPAGNLVWMKTFGGISQVPAGIVSDGAGNLVMATEFDSLNIEGSGFMRKNLKDILVVKMDPEANVIWSKQLSGDLYASGIAVCGDGRTALMGNFNDTLYFDGHHYTHLDNGSWEKDEFLVYLDANGEFDKLNISIGSVMDPAQLLPHDDDLLISSVISWHDCTSGYQLLNDDASILWSDHVPGGSISYGDCFMYENIASAGPDRFWAFGRGSEALDYGAGLYNTNLSLIQFDFTGNIISNDTFDIPDTGVPNEAAAGSSGSSLYFAGMYRDTLKMQSHTLYAAANEMVLFKMRASSATGISANEIPPDLTLRVYPNPATDQISITSLVQQDASVEIYDVLGKLLKKQVLSLVPGDNPLSVDLPAGVYPLKICDTKAGRLLCSGKLLILK